MTRYELFLAIHIVSVILWLGAGTVLGLATLAPSSVLEVSQVAAFGRWLGPRVFLPAWLGVLGAGIGLVEEGSWTFGRLWIKLGLTAFALSMLVNVTVRRAALFRLRRVLRDSPADSAAGGAVLGLVALGGFVAAASDRTTERTA